jgi:AhpC/TSA family protein
LPSVNKLYAELRDRGLEIVLVDFRESPELVRRTVRERGYAARVLLDESGDTTGRAWGVFGTPSVYVVDRQGRLVGRAVGPRDWESDAARRLLVTLLESR